MNILFSCAGRRRYLLKYFKAELSANDSIIATDMQATAPALTEADVVEIVPAVYAENYIDTLMEICIKHSVNAIISLNDLELPILANNIDTFKNIGTQAIVSSPDIIDICFDKYKTSEFLTKIGIKSPKTYISYEKVVNALKDNSLNFPVIIKPRWGSGSIGIEIANDFEDLEILYNYIKKKVKKSILATASISDNSVLIQEYINGTEYGLDIMNDLNGKHCGVSIKKKLSMRAGETDKAVTIKNNTIFSIGRTIGENLKHVANLDCDILEKDGEFYVLELNPRFGGGYPFSHEAGINMPKAIISWLKNEIAPKSCFIAEINKTFAKCDILVNVTT